jgi:DNA-binding MarR family transcriptional regulator
MLHCSWLLRIVHVSYIPSMTKPTDKQVTALRNAIDKLVRRFKIAETAGDDALKLNPIDLQAMFFVAEHPNCTATEVSQYLGVAATTMSAVADRLVRQGLITRERVSSNRRIVSLALSEEGLRRVDTAVQTQNDHCRAMLSALESDERTCFLSAIVKIADSP